MHDLKPYLSRLASLALRDGGWGSVPGQPAHPEPTCLGLLALSVCAENYPEPIARARAFLASCAVGDGTYRLARGREEAAWPTAMVLFTLSALGASEEECRGSVAALLR